MNDEDEKVYFDKKGIYVSNKFIKTNNDTILTETVQRVEVQKSILTHLGPFLLIASVIMIFVVVDKGGLVIAPIFWSLVNIFIVISGRKVVVKAPDKKVVIAKELLFWRVPEIRQALERAAFS